MYVVNSTKDGLAFSTPVYFKMLSGLLKNFMDRTCPIRLKLDMEVVANPIKLSATPASIRMPASELSQHTEGILLEYGYTWEDIAQSKQQGIIAWRKERKWF